MPPRPMGFDGGVSRRMTAVIVAMLLIILLPATMMSLPLSKIAVTVSNMEDDSPVSVDLRVYDSDDGYFSFVLEPGQDRTVTCTVTAGTHGIHVYYNFPSSQYYGHSVSESCSVSLFETEHVGILLYSW